MNGYTVKIFFNLKEAFQDPLSMGFSGKNTVVDCHALRQAIFLTQRLNPRLLQLLHCGWIVCHWATREACIFVCCCCSVMSNSLWPHGLQHARLPCPSPTPRAYSCSCPLSWWCHPTYHPLLLPPSIFPSIRVFSSESVLCIRWPNYWSFSFSISPSHEYQDWLPLGCTGLISLQSKGLSRVFSNTTVQKRQFSGAQLSL